MITQPYPSFIDPKVGGRAKPVSNGTIFIGQNQKDAIQFPEKVYYTDSKGTEIEISQPIYLNSAGVTVDSKNSSTVISPYTKSVSYSILIKNSNENPVYINDSVSGYASTEEVANAAGYPWAQGETSVKDQIYNYQPSDGPVIKVYDPIGGNVLGAEPDFDTFRESIESFTDKRVKTSPISENLINFTNEAPEKVSNLKLVRTSTSSSDNSHLMSLVDVSDCVISDLDIDKISGTGSCIIAYPTTGTLEKITFRDLNLAGDLANSLNTNGALMTSVDSGIMTRIRAEGIREFAIEYKNKTRNSIVSDSIAKNSKTAFGFGQDTVDNDDVSHCAMSNLISSGCDVGLVMGDAHYNVVSNLNVNSEGAPNVDGTAITGIRYSLTTDYCMTTGALLYGSNMAEPIRYDNANCYTSAMVVGNPSDTVLLATGANRNVTEILHPSVDDTILNKILNNSGNPVSGSNSNPTYCHSTGEYWGTFSGRWRFIHDDSGVSPALGSHRYILEGKGATFYNVLTDGLGESGYTMTTPEGVHGFQISSDADYLRLFTHQQAVRIYSSTIRMESDGVTDLGSSSNKFNTVYAVNDTIQTSDETLKYIEEIPESWFIAARNLKPIRYKWLNEMEKYKNGEREQDARWHIGYSAQSVFKALSDAGVENPWECAFLCKDALTKELEDGSIVPIVDEQGKQIERWGIRLNELNTLKIASM